MVPTGVDREARLREIADEAKRDRKRPPRGMWIAAIALSVVCVVGLAIAWIQDHDTPALKHLPAGHDGGESGLGLGLLIGAGVGIAVGSLIALRRRG